MARYFAIGAPEGLSKLALDSQGKASLQFKVKNVSGADKDAHASVVSLPVTNPPTGAVQKGWVKIDGAPDIQAFKKDDEKVIVVKIAVPLKPAPKSGDYKFRLEVCSKAVTDEGDTSQEITFTVPEIKTEPTHFPMWLIPVLAVVLIGVGIGLYFALRGGGGSSGAAVPDLSGKTVTEANKILGDAGLSLDSNSDTKESTAADSGKIIDQNPKAGDKAAKAATVHVTIGANMVNVPHLVGLSFKDAQTALTHASLAAGTVKTVANANFAGGVVTRQDPLEGQSKKAGTPVDMDVTPQTVTIQSVVGQTLGGAISSLRGQNLDVGNLSGNTTSTVIAMNPATGPVVVGTKVDLTFQSIGICATQRCFYNGTVAKLMVQERARTVHW